MIAFEEELASRLQEHEEKLRHHRSIVEQQKQWLLKRADRPAGLNPVSTGESQNEVAKSHATVNDATVTSTADVKPGAPTGSASPTRTAATKHQVNAATAVVVKSVEARLLEKGEIAKQKLEDARRKAAAEQLEREQAAMSKKFVHAAAPSSSSLSTSSRTATPPASSRNRHEMSSAPSQQRIAQRINAAAAFSAQTEFSGKPQISLASAKMALDKRRREHLDHVPIEDQLLHHGELSREEAWMRLQYYQQKEIPAHPSITKKAANLDRGNQDVADRLYAMHATAHSGGSGATGADNGLDTSSRNVDELRHLIEESVDASATPTISKKAQELHRRPGHDVCTDLYEHALQLKQQRENEQRSRAATPPARSVPKIDSVSAMIASQMQQSSLERLYQPKATTATARDSSRSSNVPPPPEFKPKISRESERLASARRSSSDMVASSSTAAAGGTSLEANFEHLHRDSQRRSAALLEKAKQVEANEMKACTFRPATNNNSLLHGSRSFAPSGGTHVITEDFGDRMEKWNVRRQQKMEEAATRTVQQELKECTFRPRLNHHHHVDTSGPPDHHHSSPSVGAAGGSATRSRIAADVDGASASRDRLSNTNTTNDGLIYGGDGRAWGYQEFVQRQEQARQRKLIAEREGQRAFIDGSGWTPQTTVPQTFDLTCYRSAGSPAKPGKAYEALKQAVEALRIAEQASLV